MNTQLSQHRMTPEHIALAGFFMPSLVIHALLLWPWLTGPARVHTQRPGQTIVAVLVEKARARAVHPARTTKASERALPKDKTALTPASEPALSKADRMHEIADTAASPQVNTAYTQLLGKLNSTLSRYLTYPPVARKRGWQGTVVVTLNIGADGQLHNIKLAQSSGYHLLDDSALTALKQLARLDHVETLLNGRRLVLTLPISYRLAEITYGTPTVEDHHAHG